MAYDNKEVEKAKSKDTLFGNGYSEKVNADGSKTVTTSGGYIIHVKKEEGKK